MPWFQKQLLFPISFFSLSKFMTTLSCSPPSPQNYEHLILSLLHLHQPKRAPSLQIHSHLITTAIHSTRMNQTSIIIWNSLIRHYSHGPFPQESISLYKQMLRICTPQLPYDTFTFSFLLKACANFSNSRIGSQLHPLVVKNGFALHLYVHTSIVNMYATCGCLRDAEKAFEEMPQRSSVSWNAMITGLAKWGEIEHASLLFERMPSPDVVSWTGMIDGLTRNHQYREGLLLFYQMNGRGIKATEITVLAVVPAISNVGSLELGDTLHAHCHKRGLIILDVRVENSLIDMYAKCGSIESSAKLFQWMMERWNLVSWTSVISGFAMHGMAREAVDLFEQMRKENVVPNRVTFLSVLNACSHGGLVEEGLHFLSSMVHEYEIEPDVKHYGCIIDMLGRAGRFGEAEKIIQGMPIEVNAVVWRTLLGCCSKYGQVEMGERVLRRIMELEKEYGGDYVVLSNMLNEVGQFGDAEKVRNIIDKRNLVKVPGISLVGGKV